VVLLGPRKLNRKRRGNSGHACSRQRAATATVPKRYFLDFQRKYQLFKTLHRGFGYYGRGKIGKTSATVPLRSTVSYVLRRSLHQGFAQYVRIGGGCAERAMRPGAD
jgi:hypothetical protein